jgi:hypothetical protein
MVDRPDGGIGQPLRGDAPTESCQPSGFNRGKILQGFRSLCTGILQSPILASAGKSRNSAAFTVIHGRLPTWEQSGMVDVGRNQLVRFRRGVHESRHRHWTTRVYSRSRSDLQAHDFAVPVRVRRWSFGSDPVQAGEPGLTTDMVASRMFWERGGNLFRLRCIGTYR